MGAFFLAYYQQGNLAFGMARIEDTNLTLAAITFQVGMNNSIFLQLQTYEQKIAEFPFL